MLMRFDPFRELDRMAQVLGRTVGDGRTMTMPMDAYRNGDVFLVHFDLPGVEGDAIDLTVEDNVITVRAERSWPRGDDQDIVVQERPQGTFSRQLFVGDSLDTDHLEAAFEGGVLSLTIPLAPRAQPRRVEVRDAGRGPQEVQTSSESSGNAEG